MRYVKKILRFLAYLFSALLLVFFLFLLVLQHGMLNQQIASFLTRQANKTLNGEVKIGKMEGNPLMLFSVKDITISRQGQTDVALDRLEISYSLTNLLKRELMVNRIYLENPTIMASQRKDSTWSLMGIFPGKQNDKAEPSQPMNWSVSVKNLVVNKLVASLNSLDSSKIPSQIQMDTHLSFFLKGDSMAVALKRMGLKATNPDLVVRDLSGDFEKVGNRITWKNLSVSFRNTRIRSMGATSLDNLATTNASMVIDPLYLQEFHPWLTGIKLYGKPTVNLELDGTSTQKDLNLQIREGRQQFSISGWVRDLEKEPAYQLTLTTKSLDGEHWTHNPSYRSNLTGQLNISGQGLDIPLNKMELQGDFGQVQYAKHEARDLRVYVKKDQGKIQGDLTTQTWFGSVSSTFNLKDIFSKPAYSIRTGFRNLDLHALSDNPRLQSDLNGSLNITGKGINMDSLVARMDLDLNESWFLENPVTELSVSMHYDRENYKLKQMHLNTPYASFTAEGEGNLRGENLLKFEVIPADVARLSGALDIPYINASGNITGRIEGTADSIRLSSRYNLKHITYDTLRVESLQGQGSAYLRDSLIAGEVDLTADSSLWGDRLVKQLSMHSVYQKNHLRNNLEVAVNDTMNIFTQTDMDLQNDPKFYIRNLAMNIGRVEWKGGSDSTSILLAKDSIGISNFLLRSGNQNIRVHGTLAFKGRENLNVSIDSLNLSKLPLAKGFDYKYQGIVNSNIQMTGTAEVPLLQGQLEVLQPVIDTLQFKKISAHLQYESDTLFFEGDIDTRFNNMIHAGMKLPFHFTLTDSISLPDKNKPFQAYLRLDSLYLNMLNPFLERSGMEVNGIVNSSVRFSNTIGDPRMDGELSLSGGAFKYEKEGISYRNISMENRFDNQRLQVERLHVESGKGSLNINGFTELPFLSDGKKHMLQVHIGGKEFRAVNSSKMKAFIDPSLTIEGTLQNPNITGEVKVVRSRINADAFRRQLSVRSDNPNPPLLVEAMKDTMTDSSVVSIDKNPKKAASTNLFGNITGTFDVKIPGNTWVEGDDMNFELQGKLKVFKQKEFVELFGNLNVNRGFFKFYGKKFDFERGNITFTGGREINPQVYFVIEYRFRDLEREKHILTLSVTGRSKQPSLSFRLDGEAIEEKNALSFLMFGKSIQQLSSGEQVSLEESTLKTARSLAIGKVSEIVTGALGSSFGLDVVEIGGGKTWKSGSVKVGKYITDDLYLSYKQTFSFDKKQKVIEPEKIALEYQLLRSLFLQATNQMNNSGFDLIFKKSWKLGNKEMIK